MKKFIEKVVGRIEESSFDLLLEITSEIEVSKNDFFLKQGKICNHLWFLKNGAVKAFEIVNGENRITHFFTEECFFTNYMSVLTKQPSELFFQATENCQVTQINYTNLEDLYNRDHRIEHIGRIMAEMQFIAEYTRRKQLLNMDALERYEYLEKNQPETFSRFSLKDIASYLGITPVSLSRLRKYRQDKS
jgi:CRP-like cAMP-binding protein